MDINFNGIDLEFVIDYTPPEAQTLIDPSVDEEFIICEVIHKGVDIIKLFNESMIESLTKSAMEQAKKDYQEEPEPESDFDDSNEGM